MENKTVGVVIPIYNVEKYLKECLDSVINQTYKNLQVILVNDGSTDENSFNIAKEYTLKDERFILFDKKNGGQGTARNVGIEYFSGEYILKNKTQILEINSLIEFNIEGNNPYEIYTVYKSYKAFHTTKDLSDFIYPSIDYIIFLDSDDYWELDCIEECVKRMNGVDLVCFDFTIFNEINDVLNWSGASSIRFFPYLSSDIIVDRLLILSKLNDYGFFLCCAWAMFIDFNFIKKNNIKFIDNVVREDNYFSFVLILNINNILITKKKLTNYRIRKGSDCNYDKSNLILSDIPERMKYLLKYFDDFDEMRQYYNIFSWIEIAKKTLTDIQKLEKNDFLFAYNLYKIFYINFYIEAFKITYIKNDPLNYKNEIYNLTNFYNYFNISKFNQNHYKPYGAVDRIKNQLSYKIGKAIIKAKNPIKALFLPLTIIYLYILHKIQMMMYNVLIRINPNIKLIPLEQYADYNEMLKCKKYLFYRLGNAFIKNPLTFIFKIKKIYKEWKNGK